jgi:hypothetical protein
MKIAIFKLSAVMNRERRNPMDTDTQQITGIRRLVNCSWMVGMWGSRLVMALFISLGLGHPTQAADFRCPNTPGTPGDPTCLINAINMANANGEANTIILGAGTYTLPEVNNTTDGDNGLPSITSPLTITTEECQDPTGVCFQGTGPNATILQGSATAPFFRLVHVATTGVLTLEGLTLTLGGGGSENFQRPQGLLGGGLLNQGGTVAISDTLFTDNGAFNGGGLYNNGGTVTIGRSMFVKNDAATSGGGVSNPSGTMTITETTFSINTAVAQGAALNNGSGGTVILTDSTLVGNGLLVDRGTLLNSGTAILTNTTIGLNSAGHGQPPRGVLLNIGGGTIILTNSTVADNTTGVEPVTGLTNFDGTAILMNTILARNTSDCGGPVTSLGNNLIGDPTGCTIILQPTDLTGNPGLGAFQDDGTPGNGHFPLLAGSRAIDAGNDAFCPFTDQLGEPRVGRCDIGAIEFQP